MNVISRYGSLDASPSVICVDVIVTVGLFVSTLYVELVLLLDIALPSLSEMVEAIVSVLVLTSTSVLGV